MKIIKVQKPRGRPTKHLNINDKLQPLNNNCKTDNDDVYIKIEYKKFILEL